MPFLLLPAATYTFTINQSCHKHQHCEYGHNALLTTTCSHVHIHNQSISDVTNISIAIQHNALLTITCSHVHIHNQSIMSQTSALRYSTMPFLLIPVATYTFTINQSCHKHQHCDTAQCPSYYYL